MNGLIALMIIFLFVCKDRKQPCFFLLLFFGPGSYGGGAEYALRPSHDVHACNYVEPTKWEQTTIPCMGLGVVTL